MSICSYSYQYANTPDRFHAVMLRKAIDPIACAVKDFSEFANVLFFLKEKHPKHIYITRGFQTMGHNPNLGYYQGFKFGSQAFSCPKNGETTGLQTSAKPLCGSVRVVNILGAFQNYFLVKSTLL